MTRVDIMGHRTLAMLYDLACPVEDGDSIYG